MRRYIRSRVGGATYFFTVNAAWREGNDVLVQHVAALRAAFREVRAAYPFEVDAIVVLPEHLHAVWTLPVDDCDYSLRWRLIKAAFSKALPTTERISASRQNKSERGVWQRRFWEHQIRDDDDFARHVDYIHFNPVKHGWVQRVADWPHSSFHRYVRAGKLPADWAGGDERGDFGEWS